MTDGDRPHLRAEICSKVNDESTIRSGSGAVSAGIDNAYSSVENANNGRTGAFPKR